MPTSGVAKAKKLKATSKSVNLFEILAEQDKKNNPPSRIIQIQMERRPIANPRNAEMGTPIRKPRKINSKPGNSKDNSYTLTDTQNTSSTDITTPTVNISVSAPLISTPNYKRAGSLVSRPFSVLSDNSNSQKDKTLSDATLRMLYRRLELQDKHLEYQDELLQEFRYEIKDLHTSISKLTCNIERITLNSQRPGLQAPEATTYATVAAEAATPSPPPPQRAQPKAHISKSSGTLEKSHFVLDLSHCDSQVISRETAYIKKRLTKGLKSQEETKRSIFHMIVDPKKTH